VHLASANNMNKYDVILYTPLGEYITRLNDFSNLDVIRTENQVGTLTLIMPMERRYIRMLRHDCQIDVMRHAGGRWNLLGDTHFLLRKWKFDDRLATLELKDGLDILDRRVVAYDEVNPQSETDAVQVDDSMKDVMLENYGASSVDANRNLSTHISIQPKVTLGPIISKQFSGRRVLAVLQEMSKDALEIANGDYMGFDMVAAGAGKFEFRTYNKMRGVDHSSPSGNPPIIFSTQRGNLSANAALTYDYSAERNYIYARGKEVGGVRINGLASDAKRIAQSPYNRIEDWISIQSDTVVTADEEANAILGEGRPRVLFEGEAMQIPNCMFGVHYGFGDLVSGEAHGVTLTCRIKSFRVSVGPTGETIGVSLSNVDIPA
jgi:hypothetical protein